MKVHYATYIGPKMDQEDCLLVAGQVVQDSDLLEPATNDLNDGPALFAVCDGVGGHEKGEVASRMACELLAIFALDDDVSAGDVVAVLHEIQEKLCAELGERAGTTVAGLALAGGRAVVFNAGDSRVYRLDEVKMTRLSYDHSLVQTMVNKGHISEEETFGHPYGNVIEFGLGGSFAKAWGNDNMIPHIAECEAPADALWLLCSDGVTDAMRESEIFAMLTPFSISALRNLVDRVADTTRDNFAIIVVERETGKPEAGVPS
jgi:serine/threonine protein phosphatase PrpC